jgi:hypothetical protein
LQFIEKSLCGGSGVFSQECKNIIDSYGPAILKYLGDKIVSLYVLKAYLSIFVVVVVVVIGKKKKIIFSC